MNDHLEKLYAIGKKDSRRIIGLMSGTSLDGLDVVLCEIKGNGIDTKLSVLKFETINYEEDFKERKDPHGRKYYWLTGEFVNFDKGKDTDVWALENNYVSVVPVQFDLTNTGKRQGQDVAQVYVGNKDSSVPRPVKELKGFEKVSASIAVRLALLAHANSRTLLLLVPGASDATARYVAAGLLVQFGIHLVGFARKRRTLAP